MKKALSRANCRVGREGEAKRTADKGTNLVTFWAWCAARRDFMISHDLFEGEKVIFNKGHLEERLVIKREKVGGASKRTTFNKGHLEEGVEKEKRG